MHVNLLIWAGILFCISQSAVFSGLNLALLSISRLRLEVEAHAGNTKAISILGLRNDSNFLLTTVLWGNVGINVLLTLLSNSVMTGVVAFLFSTVLITFAGEIAPQAYFSRNAMRMGALLAPLLRFYQVLFYPVAKPSALVLDRWLGKEGISYFREQDLHTLIRKHIESEHSDVSRLEGTGAINFLKLDDIAVCHEGEAIHHDSIIMLPQRDGKPVFPEFEREAKDGFLWQISRSGMKWVIIVDRDGQPYMALNTNQFLRDVLFADDGFHPYGYCHRPIVVTDGDTPLGKVLSGLKVHAETEADDVIENDLILVWGEHQRVITGTDILGRLLRDIASRESQPA
ncbi:MAG: DUF21 domain-containing protein [Gammaproteobacteria bacterium]|nr:DUF21 domain-containing protein [Gammaproteobacteria bacterium]MDH3535185.1 DUF21 domain-containing protein [Gammaproteobacteria bacterium]